MESTIKSYLNQERLTPIEIDEAINLISLGISCDLIDQLRQKLFEQKCRVKVIDKFIDACVSIKAYNIATNAAKKASKKRKELLLIEVSAAGLAKQADEITKSLGIKLSDAVKERIVEARCNHSQIAMES